MHWMKHRQLDALGEAITDDEIRFDVVVKRIAFVHEDSHAKGFDSFVIIA